MALSLLPTELLISTANHLSSPQDLNCLAKTSRLLYQITNPILYKNEIFHNKSSALLWAAERGKLAPCSRLLSEGANPNIKDSHKRTPMSWAAGNGHADVVSILISTTQTDPNARDAYFQTPLFWAAGNGHAEIVKLLLTVPTVDPNQQTGIGDSALIYAVAGGHVDAVNVLLANEKVDPNVARDGGITALAVAANHGRNGIMQLLVARGVEPDVKGIGGKTPLMIAAHKGNVEAVEILLSTGRVAADFDLTMRGVSFLCESRLNETIIGLLDEYNRRSRWL